MSQLGNDALRCSSTWQTTCDNQPAHGQQGLERLRKQPQHTTHWLVLDGILFGNLMMMMMMMDGIQLRRSVEHITATLLS
jgi:hypothetical protein